MNRTRFLYAPADEGAGGAGAGAGGGAGGQGAGAGGAAGSAAGGAAGGDPFVSLFQGLPEELRNDSAFKDIKDFQGLAKGYVHAQRMIGYDKVAIPGEKATPEELSAFYSKLGRPEKPEAYGIKDPEGVQVNAELKTGFLQKAHELGLSTKQAQGLFGWYNEFGGNFAKQAEAQALASQENAVKELKTEFGNAYNERIGLATQAVDWAVENIKGAEQFKEFLDSSRLGDHPVMVRLFAKIGEMLSEDGQLKGGGSGGNANASMTPDEAKVRLAEFNASVDKMKAYQDSSHPNHKLVKEERARLYSFAYPEPAA